MARNRSADSSSSISEGGWVGGILAVLVALALVAGMVLVSWPLLGGLLWCQSTPDLAPAVAWVEAGTSLSEASQPDDCDDGAQQVFWSSAATVDELSTELADLGCTERDPRPFARVWGCRSADLKHTLMVIQLADVGGDQVATEVMLKTTWRW